MTSGYVLFVAILVLGGVLATLGDRLGTRVGKARLSLFNLRPRQTAVLITIFTGSLVSASTIAILLAVDSQLRTGVFELGKIQDNLKGAKEELTAARQQKQQVEAQKQQVETQLNRAKADQQAAQRQLNQTNQSLRLLDKKNRSLNEDNRSLGGKNQALDDKNQSLNAEIDQQANQLKAVTGQVDTLRQDIQTLQIDRQKTIDLIKRQDLEIFERNRLLAERDGEITVRSRRLKQLEQEQALLETKLFQLQAQIRLVREGKVRIAKGQVLVTGLLQIEGPFATRKTIDSLFQQANRIAVQLTRPGTANLDEQIIQIPTSEVERLIDQIQDGKAYVIQILSAENYVLGEKNVQIVVSVNLNRLVIPAGEALTSARLNPAVMTDQEIRQRIELLLAAAEFRARGLGNLVEGIQIGDQLILTVLETFMTELKQYGQPVEIRVETIEDTYTISPLKIRLLALKGQQVLFQTDQPSSIQPSPSIRLIP